jgi:hypothetical protein
MISSLPSDFNCRHEKFSLYPAGIADFRRLYQLDDSRLLSESLAVADDLLSWTARHSN